VRRSGRKRVLVTGAEGTIGSALRRELADRYELVSLTLEPQDFPSRIADIAVLEDIEPAFAGVDAVVHLAASAAVESPWEAVLHNNIVGTYNVFAAARRAGLDRVIFASSTHAVAMYEWEAAPEIYRPDDERVYDHRVEIRPDSFYGASKAFGEALGRYYCERHGLRVFCLRIGWVTADEDPIRRGEVDGRGRTLWLSQRDCAQLVERCLESDLRWALVYGLSDNARRFWDITPARALLGYEPRDGAR
jgi:nucleoside-diphosphate-sugar epimerase